MCEVTQKRDTNDPSDKDEFDVFFDRAWKECTLMVASGWVWDDEFGWVWARHVAQS